MQLWTYEHFITLVPSVIVMIIIAFILRKFLITKSMTIRMIPFQIIAVILLLSEIIKQVLSIQKGYDLYHLPFHVCSLFIFLIPLMAFYKGKYVNVVKTIACSVCLALMMFMTIIPNLIYSSNNIKNFFNDYFDFHTVFFHSLVVFEFILILFLNLHENKEQNHYKQMMIFSFGYVIVAASLSQILETNYSNFYSSNIPPVADFVNLIKSNIGAVVGQTLYVIILGILHILWFTLCAYLFSKINKITTGKKEA